MFWWRKSWMQTSEESEPQFTAFVVDGWQGACTNDVHMDGVWKSTQFCWQEMLMICMKLSLVSGVAVGGPKMWIVCWCHLYMAPEQSDWITSRNSELDLEQLRERQREFCTGVNGIRLRVWFTAHFKYERSAEAEPINGSFASDIMIPKAWGLGKWRGSTVNT